MAANRPAEREPWFEVFDQLGEAILVLDDRRMVRHANAAARRLLGYQSEAALDARCRLTTRGVDCDESCPLTFALASGLERVESFPTVYRTADGRPVSLDVTIVPLLGEDGSFLGAVEILRPNAPHPGFFMAGRSQLSRELRQRALELARAGCNLAIVGQPPACLDVARAVHRFSGLPEELFRHWQGSWDGLQPWPPGVLFADGPGAWSELESNRRDGWRLMMGARSREELPSSVEIMELPPLDTLADDLPLMVAAWVEELSPGMPVTPDALERLAAAASSLGLASVQSMLTSALAVATDRLEVSHLCADGARVVFVEELLANDDPLAAVERLVLQEVVEMSGWRMQEAAERLGISRVTLWRKMKDLGIDRP